MDDREQSGSEPEQPVRSAPEGEPSVIEEPFDPDLLDDEVAPGPASGPADGPSAGDAAPGPDADDGGSSAPVAEPTAEERLAAVQEAAERTRQQLLRVAADYDNFRKRSGRELEDARRRARHGVLRELLPVFDNLERAGAHVDDASDPAAIAEGIRMVLKQFLDTLTRMGIERVEAEGRPFDPALHESIQLVDSADAPAGTVVGVAQAGYRHGDELIRPALVVVSKGQPPPPEPSAEPAEEGSPAGADQASGEVAAAAETSPPGDLGGESE